jgi:hypothetical protein
MIVLGLQEWIMMKTNSKMKIRYDPNSDEEEDSNNSDDDDDDDDDGDNNDMYDKMDPDTIAALSNPTTLQDDEDSEESYDEQQLQDQEPDKEEAGIQRRVQRGTGSQSNHC